MPSSDIIFVVFDSQIGDIVHLHKASAALGAELPDADVLLKDAQQQVQQHYPERTLAVQRMSDSDYQKLTSYQNADHQPRNTRLRVNPQTLLLEEVQDSKEADMKGTQTKEVNISLALEVEESMSADKIAATLEDSLKGLDSKVGRISDVMVRTVPRFDGLGAAGYESRLWEKATCKVTNDPRERLEDPINEMSKLQEQATDLQNQLKALSDNLSRLSQQLGR